MATVAPAASAPVRAQDDVAAVLFSGGTTAMPKGIELTNANFVAQGMQAASWVRIAGGDSMLAILPIFHGFGLAVCVNAVLMAGGIARSYPNNSTVRAEYARLLVLNNRPNDAIEEARQVLRQDERNVLAKQVLELPS